MNTTANHSSSRRAFLKTTGLALGGALTVGMAAKAPAPALAASNDAASSVNDVSWDEEYDVIVVGAGLAGMATATTVALEGAGATCLLLEKSDVEMGGGNTQFSAGMVLWTNDVEKFTKYLKELRGDMNNTPDDVLEAYAEGVGENLDWARSLSSWIEDEANVSEHFSPDQGTSCYPEYGELPDAFSLGRFNFMHMKKEGDTKEYTYSHIQQVIYAELQKHEDVVTFKHEAPMTALVQDPETKRIVGLTYESDGTTVYARARKGVVMCCGGFENNERMRADYLSAATARPVAARTNDGDGIIACAKVGADMWHMNSCAGFWTSLSPIDGDHTAMRSPKAKGITVGVNGRRFYMDNDMDVVVDWEAMSEGDLSTHVGSRHGHMQFGGEWPHLPMPKDTWLIMDADGYDAGVNGEFPTFGIDPIAEGGYGYQADTIEELAAQIPVPADELARTVEQWNECCDNGEDVYFHRATNTLTPVRTAPFYALHCSATMLNTDGGPRRSAKGEILDLDGEPIPGLYSAGEFGSIWCNMYNGGGNLGECLAFGRISARNCLGIAK
ncbi:MAG: FAD-binding protein [Coriobacteriales bacterium]|jgi:succinate dehydrogenase/fumarate reductase flavoprotein subunit